MRQANSGNVWAERWPWTTERYQLGSVVGRGTYGTVRECFDYTGRELAVKVLRKQPQAGDSKVAQSIENEVRVLREVKGCLYCVRLVDVAEDEESVFIVMEHIRGDLLRERLQRAGKLSEAEAANAVHDVLQLLSYMHERGIMHGDLAPANFIHCRSSAEVAGTAEHEAPHSLWPSRNILKAIDCGCSRHVDELGHGEGTPFGTPLYTAPEVFLKSPGLASDVWSAGMMLAEMLTGRLLFWESLQGLSAEEVLRPILRGEVQLAGAAWEGVSAEAKDLLYKMLAREAKQRISVAEALRHPWIQRWQGASCFLDGPHPHCVVSTREEYLGSFDGDTAEEVELILPFD